MRVKITDSCWIWQKGKNPKGYGMLTIDGSKVYTAHRVAYTLFVGMVPPGLTIDHLCRNRACVNPAHLEAVSMYTNVMRGESLPAKNARKSHCVRGHMLAGQNLAPRKDGRRECLTCRKDRDQCKRGAKRVKSYENS